MDRRKRDRQGSSRRGQRALWMAPAPTAGTFGSPRARRRSPTASEPGFRARLKRLSPSPHLFPAYLQLRGFPKNTRGGGMGRRGPDRELRPSDQSARYVRREADFWPRRNLVPTGRNLPEGEFCRGSSQRRGYLLVVLTAVGRRREKRSSRRFSRKTSPYSNHFRSGETPPISFFTSLF